MKDKRQKMTLTWPCGDPVLAAYVLQAAAASGQLPYPGLFGGGSPFGLLPRPPFPHPSHAGMACRPPSLIPPPPAINISPLGQNGSLSSPPLPGGSSLCGDDNPTSATSDEALIVDDANEGIFSSSFGEKRRETLRQREFLLSSAPSSCMSPPPSAQPAQGAPPLSAQDHTDLNKRPGSLFQPYLDVTKKWEIYDVLWDSFRPLIQL